MSERRYGPWAFVFGAGGLLGSAVSSALIDRSERVHLLSGLAWSEPAVCRRQVRDSFREAFASGSGVPECVELYWCAGAGFVGSDPAVLDIETQVMDAALSAFREEMAAARVPRATVTLASSAGGVWAGSTAFPITERTAPRPTHAYGEAKLEHEQRFLGVASSEITPFIGRVSNLFGPRQDLSKRQGLLSHLVFNAIHHQPTRIFVPLDTTRDYIHVRVAADVLIDYTRDLHGPRIRVIASEQPYTIASLIGELGRVLRRRVPFTLGELPSSRLQPKTLAFRTVHRRSQRLIPFMLAPAIHELVRSAVAAGSLGPTQVTADPATRGVMTVV